MYFNNINISKRGAKRFEALIDVNAAKQYCINFSVKADGTPSKVHYALVSEYGVDHDAYKTEQSEALRMLTANKSAGQWIRNSL